MKANDRRDAHPLPMDCPNSYIQDSNINEVELVLPAHWERRIRDRLFSDVSREYICHLLCGHALIGSRLRLLACYLIVPEPENYVCQTLASLELKPEWDHALRDECKRQGLSLVDFHSHPFADRSVDFSGTDDRDELKKFAYFRRNLPDCAYGSVVMAKSAERGRIFLHKEDSKEPRLLPLCLVRRDIPLVGKQKDVRPQDASNRFDRQVRAFGPEGQANLSAVKVGIVGVGGLGALIAIGLAHLGVKRFVLIDPDRVEESNLNRLAGMVAVDARLKPYKVDLVCRRMLEIDPEIRVETCNSDVFEPDGWQMLRDVDLIVAATDNHSSRMLLNNLALQYLIPLISIGTLLRLEDGGVVEGYGELFCLLPGQDEPCLLCGDVIDKAEAYYELSSEEHRRQAVARGYIEQFDEPAPAVYHLNGVMANLALIEIHNMVAGFMPSTPHLHYKMSERRLLVIEDEPRYCASCSPDGWNFARGDQIDPVTHLFPIERTEPSTEQPDSGQRERGP